MTIDPVHAPPRLSDRLGRSLRDLRLSVIDQCNLRCQYCMPEQHYTWLPRDDLLTAEEISRLVDVFVSCGVTKVRLTGGEPLIRPDLPEIVAALAVKLNARDGLADLAITTNGVLLARRIDELKAAGLRRITVSLDTLRPERFAALSRRRHLPAVLEGIRNVAAAGFRDTKIDVVVVRGMNDDELVDLIEFGKTVPAEVRFIEYMDVGGATRWARSKVFSRVEILRLLAAHYGPPEPIAEMSFAPAARYALPDGTTFGIISSTTQPFCTTCNRCRLTADGVLLLCLYAMTGINLRDPLRGGASAAELAQLVTAQWSRRADRGAEVRLNQPDRMAFLPVENLKHDPHLEMHTRGG